MYGVVFLRGKGHVIYTYAHGMGGMCCQGLPWESKQTSM